MEEINKIRLKLAKANDANENTNSSGKDYMTIRDSLTDIALLLCRVERAVGECSHENSGLNIPVVMPSNNLYEAQNWKIYTPDDDECVVVMEDSFGTKRTFDIDDFVKLMDALNSVRDY